MLSILAASMVILATLIIYLEARTRLDMKIKNLNLDVEREVEERMKIEDKYSRVLTDFKKQEELKKARDVDEMQLLFTKVNILDDKITYFSTNTKTQLDGIIVEISKKNSSNSESDIGSLESMIDEKLEKLLESIVELKPANVLPSNFKHENSNLPIITEENTVKTDVDADMDLSTGVDFKENDIMNNEIPLTDINILDTKFDDNAVEENKDDYSLESLEDIETDEKVETNYDPIFHSSEVESVESVENVETSEVKEEEFNAEDAMFKSSGDDNMEFFEENRSEEFLETKDSTVDDSIKPSVAVNENSVDVNVDEEEFLFNENESENPTTSIEESDEFNIDGELGKVYDDAVDKMENLDKELSENDDYISVEKPKNDENNSNFDDIDSSGFDIRESIEKLRAQLADTK